MNESTSTSEGQEGYEECRIGSIMYDSDSESSDSPNTNSVLVQTARKKRKPESRPLSRKTESKPLNRPIEKEEHRRLNRPTNINDELLRYEMTILNKRVAHIHQELTTVLNSSMKQFTTDSDRKLGTTDDPHSTCMPTIRDLASRTQSCNVPIAGDKPVLMTRGLNNSSADDNSISVASKTELRTGSESAKEQITDIVFGPRGQRTQDEALLFDTGIHIETRESEKMSIESVTVSSVLMQASEYRRSNPSKTPASTLSTSPLNKYYRGKTVELMDYENERFPEDRIPKVVIVGRQAYPINNSPMPKRYHPIIIKKFN